MPTIPGQQIAGLPLDPICTVKLTVFAPEPTVRPILKATSLGELPYGTGKQVQRGSGYYKSFPVALRCAMLWLVTWNS